EGPPPLFVQMAKAEAVLHHAGVAYDFENVNIMDMPDWFVEISPARRIPVLRDKTIATEGIPGTIPDSTAIAIFLNDKFGLNLYGDTAFDKGRAAWYEEYADTVLAMHVGLDIFRPIIFSIFQGKAPDMDTVRTAWAEKFPKLFDYLEASLDGGEYFVGGKYSIADISVATHMAQIELVVGLPDAAKWPALVKHTEAMKTKPGFVENLATCGSILPNILPEKLDPT
ncbi:MAG: glutathione S-transferase family protein, partial [Pseudomonadota bacterium]